MVMKGARFPAQPSLVASISVDAVCPSRVASISTSPGPRAARVARTIGRGVGGFGLALPLLRTTLMSRHLTLRHGFLALSLLLLGAAACSSGAATPPVSPESDAGLVPDSGSMDAGDAGTEALGAPIVAPADQWTWVDFPESRCLKGSSTGIGVRLRPGSRRLVLYMMGGGGCSTAACWSAKQIGRAHV